MARPRRDRHGTILEVTALGTALGPRVRLTIGGTPMLLTAREADHLAQWLWDAAELVRLDGLEGGE